MEEHKCEFWQYMTAVHLEKFRKWKPHMAQIGA